MAQRSYVRFRVTVDKNHVGQFPSRDRAEVLCAQMLRRLAGRRLENSEGRDAGALVMFYFDVSNLAELTGTAEGVGAHGRTYTRLDDALEVRVARRSSVLIEGDQPKSCDVRGAISKQKFDDAIISKRLVHHSMFEAIRARFEGLDRSVFVHGMQGPFERFITRATFAKPRRW